MATFVLPDQNAENIAPSAFAVPSSSKGLAARAPHASAKTFGAAAAPRSARKALGDMSNRHAFGGGKNQSVGAHKGSGVQIFSDARPRKAAAYAPPRLRTPRQAIVVEDPEYMAPRGPDSPDYTEQIREMDQQFAAAIRPDAIIGRLGTRPVSIQPKKMAFKLDHDEMLSDGEGKILRARARLCVCVRVRVVWVMAMRWGTWNERREYRPQNPSFFLLEFLSYIRSSISYYLLLYSYLFRFILLAHTLLISFYLFVPLWLVCACACVCVCVRARVCVCAAVVVNLFYRRIPYHVL